jgi:hypothetical protein
LNRTALVPLCALFALLFCACGEAAPSPAATPLPEDVLAKRLVLAGSELPQGWKVVSLDTPPAVGTGDDAGSGQGCDIPANAGITGRGSSGKYVDASGETLSATVVVMRTPDDIQPTLDTFSRRMGCLVTAVNAGQLDDSSAIYSDASFKTYDNPAQQPAQAIHYFQMHARSKSSSAPVKEATLYIDTIVVVHDRFVSSLVISSAGNPPSTEEELTLAQKAWDKLQTAP